MTEQQSAKTSLVCEYLRIEGDPYYTIPRPENTALYARYKEFAQQATDVHFVGRLRTSRYYNMDQVAAQALVTFRKILWTDVVIPVSSFYRVDAGVDVCIKVD